MYNAEVRGDKATVSRWGERWLNELDEAQRRDVIILGDELTRNLFSGRPALGATVLLNDIRFEVIAPLSASAAATRTLPTCADIFRFT